MGMYEMGIEVSIPAKDKAWAETQKREILSNAWGIKSALQKDVKGVEVAIGALALAVLGGAYVVYRGVSKKGR